jgi:hypothetical protein
MNTKEVAIAYAEKLTHDYPNARNVRELMDMAIKDGRFENKNEMLSVWGRVCRLLPQN